MTKPDPRADEIMARAAYFTTSRFKGVGRYDTRRFATLREALADARGDRRAMVYAVDDRDFSACLNGTIHMEPSNGK